MGVAMPARLAFYDLDKTITRRATYTPFLLHAARRLAPWRLLLLPLAALLALAYAAKLIDRGKLKELNYRLLIGRRVPPERLAAVVESFADETLATNTYPAALTAIEADRAAGRRLILATASYEFYAAAIAKRLGFDDIIATRTGVDAQGRLHPRIQGANCYGQAKKDRVESWLAAQGLTRATIHLRFYSDHPSDAPLHRWADEAVAANPDARLAKLAKAEGWEVVRWGTAERSD
jgi:HAD superfamily hydrolase (TIGR01490 family)